MSTPLSVTRSLWVDTANGDDDSLPSNPVTPSPKNKHVTKPPHPAHSSRSGAYPPVSVLSSHEPSHKSSYKTKNFSQNNFHNPHPVAFMLMRNKTGLGGSLNPCNGPHDTPSKHPDLNISTAHSSSQRTPTFSASHTPLLQPQFVPISTVTPACGGCSDSFPPLTNDPQHFHNPPYPPSAQLIMSECDEWKQRYLDLLQYVMIGTSTNINFSTHQQSTEILPDSTSLPLITTLSHSSEVSVPLSKLLNEYLATAASCPSQPRSYTPQEADITALSAAIKLSNTRNTSAQPFSPPFPNTSSTGSNPPPCFTPPLPQVSIPDSVSSASLISSQNIQTPTHTTHYETFDFPSQLSLTMPSRYESLLAGSSSPVDPLLTQIPAQPPSLSQHPPLKPTADRLVQPFPSPLPPRHPSHLTIFPSATNDSSNPHYLFNHTHFPTTPLPDRSQAFPDSLPLSDDAPDRTSTIGDLSVIQKSLNQPPALRIININSTAPKSPYHPYIVNKKPSLPSDNFLSYNPRYLPPPPLSYLIPLHSDSPSSRHLLHRNASLLLTQRKQIISIFSNFRAIITPLNTIIKKFDEVSNVLDNDFKGDMVASHLANPKAMYIYNIMNQHQVIAQQQELYLQHHETLKKQVLNGTIGGLSSLSSPQFTQNATSSSQQSQSHAKSSQSPSVMTYNVHNTINSHSTPTTIASTSSSHDTYLSPTHFAPQLSFGTPGKHTTSGHFSAFPTTPGLSGSLVKPNQAYSQQFGGELLSQPPLQKSQPPLSPQPLSQPSTAQQGSTNNTDITTTHDLFLLGNLFTLDTTFQSFSVVLSQFSKFFQGIKNTLNTNIISGIEHELSTECTTLLSLYNNYIEALTVYDQLQENIQEKQEKWLKNNAHQTQTLLQQQYQRRIINDSLVSQHQRQLQSHRDRKRSINCGDYEHDNPTDIPLGGVGYSRFSTVGPLPSQIDLPQQQQDSIYQGSGSAGSKDSRPQTPRGSLFSRFKKDKDSKNDVTETISVQSDHSESGAPTRMNNPEDYGLVDTFDVEVLQYLVSHYHQHQNAEYSKYSTSSSQSQYNSNYTGASEKKSESVSAKSNDSHTPNPTNPQNTIGSSTNSANGENDMMEIVGFGSGGVVTVSLRQRPTPFNTVNNIQQAANVSNKLPQIVPPSPRSRAASSVRLRTEEANQLQNGVLIVPNLQSDPSNSSTTAQGNSSAASKSGNTFDFHPDSGSALTQSISSTNLNKLAGSNPTSGHFPSFTRVNSSNVTDPTSSSGGMCSCHHIGGNKEIYNPSLQPPVLPTISHTSFLNFDTSKCPATFQLLLHYQHPCVIIPQVDHAHNCPALNSTIPLQHNEKDNNIYCIDICLFPPAPPMPPTFSPYQQLFLAHQHFLHIRTLLILYLNYLLVSSRIQTISTINAFLFNCIESLNALQENTLIPQVDFLYEYQFRLQELYNVYCNYQESIWLYHSSTLEHLQSLPYSLDSILSSPHLISTIDNGGQQSQQTASTGLTATCRPKTQLTTTSSQYDHEYQRYLIDEVVPIRTTIPTLLQALEDETKQSGKNIVGDDSLEPLDGRSISFTNANQGSSAQTDESLSRSLSHLSALDTTLSFQQYTTAQKYEKDHGVFNASLTAQTGFERILASLSFMTQNTENNDNNVAANGTILSNFELNRQALLHMLSNPPPYLQSNMFNLPMYKQPSPQLLFTTPKIILCGYLLKQATNITKEWQKRYFILTTNALLYFRDCTCYNKPLNQALNANVVLEGYTQDVSQLQSILFKDKKSKNAKKSDKNATSNENEEFSVKPPIVRATMNPNQKQFDKSDKNGDFPPDSHHHLLHTDSHVSDKHNGAIGTCECNVGIKVVDILLSSARLPSSSSKLLKPKFFDTSFELVSPNRRCYLLRCVSTSERDLWLQTIQKTIGDSLTNNTTQPRSKSKDPLKDIPPPPARRRASVLSSNNQTTRQTAGSISIAQNIENSSNFHTLSVLSTGPPPLPIGPPPLPTGPPPFLTGPPPLPTSGPPPPPLHIPQLLSTSNTNGPIPPQFNMSSSMITLHSQQSQAMKLISPPQAYPFISTIKQGPSQFQKHSSQRMLSLISQNNPTCADCSTPLPDWCSINNGVLICIRCSAIHRSLGVQISKVRSITLDSLDVAVEALLSIIGNSAFNAIFEGNLISELCSKPYLDQCTHAEREEFISMKYTKKAFVSKQILSTYTSLKKDMSISLFWAISYSDLPTIMKLYAVGCDFTLPFECPVNIYCALDDEISHIDESIDVNIVLRDEKLPDTNPDGTPSTINEEFLLIPQGSMTTPLHYAIIQGDITIIEYLLLNNCSNTNLKDGLGRTPIELAKKVQYEYGVQRLSRR